MRRIIVTIVDGYMDILDGEDVTIEVRDYDMGREGYDDPDVDITEDDAGDAYVGYEIVRY